MLNGTDRCDTVCAVWYLSAAGLEIKKYPPFGEYLKLVAETGFEPATSGL